MNVNICKNLIIKQTFIAFDNALADPGSALGIFFLWRNPNYFFFFIIFLLLKRVIKKFFNFFFINDKIKHFSVYFKKKTIILE
jgi:hypothetical protein